MKTITKVLLKKKWILKNNTIKRPYLFEKNKRLSGKILCIIFNKFSTYFEVSDFVKTSKKQRSNVVDQQIKDIFQYNVIGICISQKKDQYFLNTQYIIRNTFERIPYEITLGLYSPIIETIFVYKLIEKFMYLTHSKYYYLRKKPMPMSTIVFDFVTDMFDQEIIQEEMSEKSLIEKINNENQ